MKSRGAFFSIWKRNFWFHKMLFEINESFVLFLLLTAAIPIYWNLVARSEHHYGILSRLFGCKYYACYTLAVTGIYSFLTYLVFFTSLYRNYLYKLAMQDQLSSHPFLLLFALPLGYPLLLLGSTLVLSSMYVLGVVNTYHGDHFGIFMTERVESFPFSVTENPMYTGSTMVFLAGALLEGSVAGLVMTLWVFVCYQIALLFEGFVCPC
jgi:phosphatidylethanolamine N-methyltransferase